MLQWIQQNLGIIIIALSFGVSGLGWLFQQLKQAQEKKKAEQLRQRARLEALRTGRVEGQAGGADQRGSTAASPQAEKPRQRLEELARRRQQEQQQRSGQQRTQLEEQLRRRREAIEAQRQRQQEQRQRQVEARRSSQRPQTSQSTQGRPAQGRSGQGQPQQRPTARQRPDQARTTQPQASQPARRPADRRAKAAPPTDVPIQQSVITDVIEAQRRGEDVPVQAPIVTGRRRGLGTGLGAGLDLRQAVMMREILEKPIGLRPPSDENF